MRYSNYKNYNDPIKPYIYDSLEMLRILEYKQYQDIQLSYIEVIKPITDYIANQKGKFEGIDKVLDDLIEKAKKNLDERLNFIIYDSLKRGASIALSVSARLKVDEELYSQKKLNGEMHLIGEASRSTTKDKNLIVKKIQLDVSKKSEEIARHTMEKQRLYREKEFKLSSRVWDLSNGQGEKIKKLVEAGVNMDCKKLAKALDECAKMGNSKPIKEYPNMMKRLKGRFPPDTSFAAMRVARNELSELYFTTSIKDYMENPYIEAVQWLLANNRLKMYEDECDCNDIAYEDVYGLGRGIYPLDKVPDRPHVMCLCTIAPITSRKLKKQLEGGMKLGNVPTEEWLKKQNHEDNIELIKSKYIETGLKLFHNEKGRALGLASIDIIKEHKWFIDGVHDEDKKNFLDNLHKVNGRALYILARHTGDMQVEFYSEEPPQYDPIRNKIFYNLIGFANEEDNKKAGFKLGMLGFLHETGHWLDSNRFNEIDGLNKRMPKLFDVLKKDMINYINSKGKQNSKDYSPIKDINKSSIKNISKNIKELITNEIKKNIDVNSNISDLMGGLTYEQIAGYEINGLYGHGVDYWRYESYNDFVEMIKSETVAMMFETLGSGGDRLIVMNKYFPNSWIYFNSIINRSF